MQQKLPDLPWFSEARLVSPRSGTYDGPLMNCVRRWDRLAPIDRAQAFIVIQKDGRTLTPTELSRIVSSPEFLSL
jgi:hypothetical protein